MENIQFSLFKGFCDLQPVPINLSEVLQLIRQDAALEKHTHQYRYFRHSQQDAAADRIKASSPCISVSVRFEGGRRNEHIVGWTGIGMVDLDHIPAEQLDTVIARVNADPHTFVSFTTISGLGRRILFCYDGLTDQHETNNRLHLLAFQEMNRYYSELTGLPVDQQCKNSTRLTVLSHDADVYVNPHPEVFHATPLLTRQNQYHNQQKQSRRNDQRLDKVTQHIARDLQQRGIQYEAHAHNRYVMEFGYQLNAYGIPQDLALSWAEKQFADYPQTRSVLQSCYRHTEEFATRRLSHRTSGKGNANTEKASRPSVKAQQILDYLNSRGHFRFNAVTHYCEIAFHDTPDTWVEINDRYVNDFWFDLSNTYGRCRRDDIFHVLNSNQVPVFHPFLDYIQQCPAWDGVTDYIDRLACTVTPCHESAFFRYYFKKWFVAMVASLRDEEKVNHEVLLLIGKQGIYKTTWISHLLPPELRRYIFVRSQINAFSRDETLSLSECALYCLEELDAMDSKRMAQFKTLVTTPTINERLPYDRTKMHLPHLCSFCATSNNTNLLNDLMGTRRFLTIEVKAIDMEQARKTDYQGLFAQAIALIDSGYSYWLNDQEIEDVNQHNHAYEVPYLERELILKYYRHPRPGEVPTFVSNADILATLSRGIRIPLNPINIGIFMTKLGFSKVSRRQQRGYLVILQNPYENDPDPEQ